MPNLLNKYRQINPTPSRSIAWHSTEHLYRYFHSAVVLSHPFSFNQFTNGYLLNSAGSIGPCVNIWVHKTIGLPYYGRGIIWIDQVGIELPKKEALVSPARERDASSKNSAESLYYRQEQ
jgi:hypothetical protein